MQGREEGVSPRFGRDCTFRHPAGMLPMQYQKEIQYQYNKNNANLQECTSLGCTDVSLGEMREGPIQVPALTLLMALPLWNQRLGTRFGPRFLTRCPRTGYSAPILMALGKHHVLPVRRKLMSSQLKTHLRWRNVKLDKHDVRPVRWK